MREIKFRGKCKEKWLYGDFIHQDKFNRSMIKQDNYTAVVDVNTLGQYIGLKDKNGIEIYEGDIVKINKHSYDYGLKKDEIGEIKFIDGAFGFYREKTKNEYYFNDLATENGYGELDYYEVIGNIYDNPELLEE